MTATVALSDRWLIYRVAGEAQVDPRTVRSALQGRKGKGSAYERTLKFLAVAGVDLASIQSTHDRLADLRRERRGLLTQRRLGEWNDLAQARLVEVEILMARGMQPDIDAEKNKDDALFERLQSTIDAHAAR